MGLFSKDKHETTAVPAQGTLPAGAGYPAQGTTVPGQTYETQQHTLPGQHGSTLPGQHSTPATGAAYNQDPNYAHNSSIAPGHPVEQQQHESKLSSLLHKNKNTDTTHQSMSC